MKGRKQQHFDASMTLNLPADFKAALEAAADKYQLPLAQLARESLAAGLPLVRERLRSQARRNARRRRADPESGQAAAD
ncbi:MAG: hypothetical protein F4Z14_00510 [Gammaproteobacteria bacterium]|nr:hypothetical protein [Gammaproteobacteria bacterium]